MSQPGAVSSSIASVISASLRKDKCLRPSGSGYCNFGSSATFNFERTDSFTIYVWARWTQSTVGSIFNRVSGGGSGRGWELAYLNTGELSFTLKNSSGGTNALGVKTTATGWNDGKWHSLMVTYGGTSVPSGVHIYVDGNDQPLTTTVNTLSATIQSTTPMSAGQDANQGAFEFTGDLGNMAVFTGVLGTTDLATLHNGRRPPVLASVLAITGILGYWRMGEGAAVVFPTVPDETNANPGTLTSLATTDIRTYGPPYS